MLAAATAAASASGAGPRPFRPCSAFLALITMSVYLARPLCGPRAFKCAAAGALLPGGAPALAAATDSTLQLLIATRGAEDGEGQLEVVAEQPLFATARALAAVPRPAGKGAEAEGQQDWLALLSDSGFLSILRYDAAAARFVAVQQLRLPPEPPGDPLCLLAVHPGVKALAVASAGGSLCVFVPSACGAGAEGAGQEAAAAARSVSAGSVPEGSVPAGSAAAGAGPISGPALLIVQQHLRSLAFLGEEGEEAGGSDATGSSSQAQQAQQLSLAALHQHPRSPGSWVAVRYSLQCHPGLEGAESGGAAPQLAGRLDLADFAPLSGSCYAGTAGGEASGQGSTSQEGPGWCDPGALLEGPHTAWPNRNAGQALGRPLALVQPPTGSKGEAAFLVLREQGLQLIPAPAPAPPAEWPGAGVSPGTAEQWRHEQRPTQAAEALQGWWAQQGLSAPRRQQQAGPSSAAAAAAAAAGPEVALEEGPERPLSPAGSPASSSLGRSIEEMAADDAEGPGPEGPQAMLMSQQPSLESMAEDEEGDEGMQDAEDAAGGSGRARAEAEAEAEAARADAAAAGGQGAEEAGLEVPPPPPPAAGEAAGSAAAAAAEGAAAGPFVVCWCWEQPGGSSGQQQQAALLCALSDGSLCRLELPAPAAEDSSSVPAGGALPGRLLPVSQGSRRIAQLGAPPCCLASLPGGLLTCFAGPSGVQLLQRGGAGGAGEAGAYEPLFPPHLLAAQPQLAEADAGVPGCCTLPGAGAIVDCVIADLEGGSSSESAPVGGQKQLYAACRAPAAHTTAAGGGGSGRSGALAASGGSLCVLAQDPRPETVFELPGAAEGITGLWGLKRSPGDASHSLALLSYVGGSRLLAVQGGIFRDVTDRYDLHAGSQTLAAGILGAGAAATAGLPAAAGGQFATPALAQVTPAGVVLCSSSPAALSRQSSGQMGLPGAFGGANGSSIAGGGSAGPAYAWQPPAGSTIGSAVVAEEGVLLFCTGPSRQRELVVLLPEAASGAAGGSGGGGRAASQQGQLPQLVQAARLALPSEASCLSNLLLPGKLQGPGSQRCGLLAVGTYGSAVLLLRLRWDAQQPQHASLAALRMLDLTASSIAQSMEEMAAAAAAAAGAPQLSLSPRAFQREQLTPESLLLVLPAPAAGQARPGAAAAGARPAAAGPAAAGLAAAGPASAAAAAAAESSGPGQLALDLIVGLRTGSMLQLRVSLGSPGQAAGQQAGQQPAEEELLAVSLGHMPLVLLPLPPQQQQPTAAAAGATAPSAVVLSDRVSLLHCPPAGPGSRWAGRVHCQALGLPTVRAAAALLLDGGGLGGSSLMCDAAQPGEEADPQQAQQAQPPQLFLLCAAADGCLRMVSLDPLQLASVRSWPLPQQLSPRKVAAHAASGCVVVAGDVPAPGARRMLLGGAEDEEDEYEEEGAAETAAVQVIDPATGELLARFAHFLPGEAVTALTVWDPFEFGQLAPQQHAQQQQEQQEQAPAGQAQAEPAAALEAALAGAAADGQQQQVWAAEEEQGSPVGGGEPGSGGSLRSHPITFSPGSPASAVASAEAAAAALAAAAGEVERPWGGFVVVGTSIKSPGGDGFGADGQPRWDDEGSVEVQGRLLLLQLTTPTAASVSGSGRSPAAAAEAAAAAAAVPGAPGLAWELVPPRRQLQLLPVAQLHLPGRVLALCPGSTNLTGRTSGGSTSPAGGERASTSSGSGSGAGGGYLGSRLLASVGRRLVAYEWRERQQLLRRVAWIPTPRPVAFLQVTANLLAAADRGDGGSLYRYYEPPPGSLQEQREQQRARLARRFRLAPPGAAELRQRLGLGGPHRHHNLRGAGGGLGGRDGAGGEAGGSQPGGGEDQEVGFVALAADSACRPAVGTVGLGARPVVPGPPTSSSSKAGGSTGSAGAAELALAAAVLDCRGQLRLLRQNCPRHEPTLHSWLAFQLGEPAVALLPGSLGPPSNGSGGVESGTSKLGGGTAGSAGLAAGAAGGLAGLPAISTAAAGAAGPEPAGQAAGAEMVVVAASGAVLALQPVDSEQAGQLLALQRALAAHPASAPISGADFAAFRGVNLAARTAVPLLFAHPPPPAVDPGAAEAVDPPQSPRVGSPAEQPLGAAEEAGGEGFGARQAADAMAVDARPGSAGSATGTPASPSALAAAAGAGAAAEGVLDADMLQQFLLLPPEEQQALLASAGVFGGGGGESMARAAARLTTAVAQLLL